MPTNLKFAEPSFRFGCGRYLQDVGILNQVGEEIKRLGKTKPFVLGGKTALTLTKEKILKSCQSLSIAPTFYTYEGFCNKDHCDEIIHSKSFQECDLVIGVGGGNCMDAAKLCAIPNNKPIINIPTSSATCACFTPLSVTYNDIGQTIGTIHLQREVDCVLVDMIILSSQPQRLLLAGAYDALAKVYELKQRMLGIKKEDLEIGLSTSYYLSEYIQKFITEHLADSVNALQNHLQTKTLFDMVYVTLALTGVVSGLARGSNQTALGHKIYESLRKLYPREVYEHLHGEMVAIGLILQIEYNQMGGVKEFIDTMKKYNMKTSITELGVPGNQDTLEKLYEVILKSSAMAGTNEEEQARLKRALSVIL